MYYKEAIINGVLCCKTSPNGEWIRFDSRELTSRLIKLQDEITSLKTQLEMKVNGDNQNENI